MGAVYEGKHPVIEKRVAIKVLKPERSVDPELVQRFLNEARATSAIRHPNIVEVMDLGTLPSGAPYLVMELLEGETLGDRLDRVGKLDLSVALDFARQTASALQAAHVRGIVHRDLKPDNVFLVPDPRLPDRELVKVLDFGIAKLRGEWAAAPVDSMAGAVRREWAGAPADTLAGAVLGTPSYMSPEQCKGVPEQLDHRTDIYALGVMLYEMVCGAPPFVADELADTMTMHMSMPPPPPSSLGAEVPEEVERAILRALAKRPEDRFASMAELRAALEPAPSPVVVFPAAVQIGVERSAARALASGERGGVPVPRAETAQVERARPVSGSALRRTAADAAADAAEMTALTELMTERSGLVATDPRTRRDDEDTAPGDGPRRARRRNAFAAVTLLCAAMAAASWLVPGMTATEPAAAAGPSAQEPTRLDTTPRNPAADSPGVPMAAVLAPASAPVVVSAAPRAGPTTNAPKASSGRARRPRLQRATAEADPAAPSRADVDTANAFAPLAAADDWQAEASESVAASGAAAAPSSSASQPPAVDSVPALSGPSMDAPGEAPQLAASAATAKNAAESPLASRALTTAAAKSGPSPPATVGRVSIEDLLVRGSLPESVVRRGIERVRTDFENCYRKAAGGPGRAGLGRVAVSFELDELGRVRDARASGSSVASLDRCVADATRHITSRRAPDTGTVRGSFQLVVSR